MRARRGVAKGTAAEVLPILDRVFAHLADAGVFTDTIHAAVDQHFIPQLLQMVTEQMDLCVNVRSLFYPVQFSDRCVLASS